jgi:hypothetical protein
MADEQLRPATREELIDTLSFGLRYRGRRRVQHADAFMAQVGAENLLEHLERSGFVIMKRPPAATPKAPDYGKSWL